MKEVIKSDVLSFFNEKEYHRANDTEYQTEAFRVLLNLNLPFEIDTDHRNYSHSVGAIFDFGVYGEILKGRYQMNSHSLEQFLLENQEITTVFISFSDINKYLRVFANRHYLNEKGEVEVVEISIEEIDAGIKIKIQSIIDELVREIGFTVLENKLLEEEVYWLNECDQFKHITFMSRIDDLVFGGFELYSKLGI